MKALYPGTFDPITNGHIDIVRRASRLCDELVLAVADNPGKGPFFDLKERVALARRVLADLDNVSVIGFDGLLIDFAKKHNASVIVRGLRAIGDFEYEVQLAGLNRQMNPNIETIFIGASQEHAFLSSSMVREISRLGGNVGDFVDPIVYQALNDRLARSVE